MGCDTASASPTAIAAPRVHHQWLPDEVRHEASLDPALAAGLVALGHKLVARDHIGDANCIERDPATGDLRAVADVARGGGAAAAR